MSHFLIYVRRSYRPSGAPDISDEAQVEAATAMLPIGATHDVIADSGGHHSGRNDQRDGYQEMIRRVETEKIAGLAVYDLSRLARNAQLMHNLKAALDRRNVPLLVSNMPTSRWDTAVGRFMFGQLVLAAQFQADLDSERMTAITRHAFEDGRHRGNPPRGYRNGKDATNRRTLEIDPDQAPRVRQIVALLADHSYGEVASWMTADGYPMTLAAVKDVARRLRVYLGFVVRGRGLDERPGRHEPLITEDAYRAAMTGIRRRTRAGVRARPHRVYLLSGVVYCQCGAKMTGEARVSRGREWRYYRCRQYGCEAPMLGADAAEASVLAKLARLPLLTRRTLDRAEVAYQERITGPIARSDAKQRERIATSIANLRKQHEWGDLSDAEYRAAVAARQHELAKLPAADKLVAFTQTSRLMASLADLIADGGPLNQQRLVRLAVDRVTTRGGQVRTVLLARVIRDALWQERPRTAARRRQPIDQPSV